MGKHDYNGFSNKQIKNLIKKSLNYFFRLPENKKTDIKLIVFTIIRHFRLLRREFNTFLQKCLNDKIISSGLLSTKPQFLIYLTSKEMLNDYELIFKFLKCKKTNDSYWFHKIYNKEI